jgi:hypothetical protein
LSQQIREQLQATLGAAFTPRVVAVRERLRRLQLDTPKR